MRTLEEILMLDEYVAATEIGGAIFDVASRELSLDALPPPQRRIVLVHLLEVQVLNGGFSQYFFNSSGDHATETVAALRYLGAHSTAALLQSAIEDFGASGPPRERKARIERLRELESGGGQRWGELDHRFYEYPDNLPGAIVREVRQHPDEFRDLQFQD